MGAAPGFDRDVAQALRARPGGGCGLLRWIEASHERVQGKNNEEVNSSGHQQERYDGVDEIADWESCLTDLEPYRTKIGLTNQGSDEWSQQILCESRNYPTEGRTDDHADRQVDYIPAQDEFLEAI
jgi:hypothetical protein